MSTILDALRKAKRAPPPKDAVDARGEILRSETHDYLAAPPDDADGRVRFLKNVVYGAVVVIAALSVVVVVLLVKGRSPADRAEPTASSREASVPAEAAAPAGPAARAAPRAPAASPSPPPRRVIELRMPPVATMPTPAALSPAKVPVAPTATPPRVSEPPTAKKEESRQGRRKRLESLVENIRVEGVLWDRTAPMAVVDGKIVKVGSRIGKARVVEINKDSSVVVEIEGEQFTLR